MLFLVFLAELKSVFSQRSRIIFPANYTPQFSRAHFAILAHFILGQEEERNKTTRLHFLGISLLYVLKLGKVAKIDCIEEKFPEKM